MFFIASFIIVSLYLLLLFWVSNYMFPKNSPAQSPNTSTISPTEKPYAGETSKEGPRKGELLLSLIQSLPYSGKYFRLTYDNNIASFILNVDPNNETQGNAEFDSYLKTRGFSDKSELINLTVSRQPM